MVGFDAGEEKERLLDGKSVAEIHPNLRTAADTTVAKAVTANAGVSFMGDTKGGAFDVSDEEALGMLRQPNPHGRPNSDGLSPGSTGSTLRGEFAICG